ncbi:fibroblast growth factor receptor substrate 2 [Phlebotomus papatasi]|uniref:fibroblast growth factor receptor substrate 2 n=1 Tax=Phlebotomus papatasi TaxID=29031 RepID=UPI0024838957|nr:fibroblast growth factor receptor substrate 2 [Phlebotomus papatasi]XP_055712033.1 fibroblast growth factor receptor substrate 2 [Phlebotomus papatasi]XP_055712034.1 fibroblast growth factor receptor substrate 2 [Phlebotomus papatasi]XP_055712035.1 fibroblast growth factor receptor substrate 2 [Phlebotomus papatasi]
MGCINSKRDINDTQPNVFRVININEDGLELWSGDIEVNWTNLILYRKGKQPTLWPLRCLRRYGYDGDVFCFEAGRRCLTGEGIYSFRCRRAENLFNLLQTHIEGNTYNAGEDGVGAQEGQMGSNRHSTLSTGSAPRPNSGVLTSSYIIGRTEVTSPSQVVSPNGTIHSISVQSRSSDTLTEGNYLEPTPIRQQAPVFPSGMRLGSVGSGPISPDLTSPGSPNSITNILEVTTLNPLPSTQAHHGGGVSNVYQEFPLREHNNNKKLSLDVPPQENAPAEPLSDDCLETSPSRIPDLLSQKSICSPTASVDLDTSHMYMNIAPGEMKITKSLSNPTQIESGSDNSMTPTSTSLFRFSRMNSYGADPERCYENLNPSEMKPLLNRFVKSTPADAGIVSEPGTPTSDNRVVNYIVLDLDQSPSTAAVACTTPGTTNPDTTGAIASLLPPESPKKAALGYATIDFNKTAALSNSTTPSSELDSEGATRKTRHSSSIVVTRQSNSISD